MLRSIRSSTLPTQSANEYGEVLRPQRSLARSQEKGGSAFIVPLCPLCSERDNETAFWDNGRQLRVCGVCSLFFVHPYPRSSSRHNQVTTGKVDGIDLLDCEERYRGERLYYGRHFAMIEEECRGARSFLDVGCGTGHLLERLSPKTNLRRMGIELNAQAARFARRTAGCDIAEIPFEDFQASAPFDVVALINVLSHIPSLDCLFESLRTAIAPGGKVILRTSEMSRDVSRWNQLHWGIPDDIHFLGLGTLDFLCRKYGFVIRRHVRVPYEDELFLRSRWQQVGRRRFVNALKKVGLGVPGALAAMKSAYRALIGQRLFVSFIVLRPIPFETEPNGGKAWL